MKLLVLLIFLGVFLGAKLFFRLRETASAAVAQARRGGLAGPSELVRDMHAVIDAHRKQALLVANQVGEVVPGARAANFEFALWVAGLMSPNLPGALRPDEIGPGNTRDSVAGFLAGALEVFAEDKQLLFSSALEFERYMRRTLTEVGVGYLGRGAVEAGMACILSEAPEKSVEQAYVAGGVAARDTLRGIEPAPYENALRDVVRATTPNRTDAMSGYRPFTLKE